MHSRSLFFVLCFFCSPFGLSSQQAVTAPGRDSQAVAMLQSSLSAMGGTVPADSVAGGNIVIVAGSLTSTGKIRILTRSNNQSSEQITLPELTWTVTYSGGVANQTVNSTTTSFSFERAVTSQSVCFPVPFLAAALASADISVQYVGLETLNQQSVQHIRLQNSFASQPDFQQYADFAVFDVWLDANTALPAKISFVRRDAGGSAPRIPIETSFFSYQNMSGIVYPSRISVAVNGTPWATITISSVSFNTGLTDSSFSIQ